ncbi:MAG: hypothetical protein RIR69_872, partial [Actinomycetota bacterium]
KIGCEPEMFQHTEGIGGQAITAALVARKRCLVDNGDLVTQAVQRDCTRSTRRASTDNENLLGHGNEARGGSG